MSKIFKFVFCSLVICLLSQFSMADYVIFGPVVSGNAGSSDTSRMYLPSNPSVIAGARDLQWFSATYPAIHVDTTTNFPGTSYDNPANGTNIVVVVDRENSSGQPWHEGFYAISNVTININNTEGDNLIASSATMRPIPVPLAVASGGVVNLTWNVPTEDNTAVTTSVIGYYLLRSTSSTSNFVLVTSNIISTRNYSDTPVTTGVTYYYVIKLVYQGGVSSNYYSANSNAVYLTKAIIDDFEDNNLNSNPDWDASFVGFISSTAVTTNQGTYSLRITGNATGYYGGNVGAYIANQNDDWSQYQYLRFWVYNGGQIGDTLQVRIIEDDSGSFSVNEGAGTAGDDLWIYSQRLSWAGGWQEVTITLNGTTFVDSNPSTGNNTFDIAPSVATPGVKMFSYYVNSKTATGAVDLNIDTIRLSNTNGNPNAPSVSSADNPANSATSIVLNPSLNWTASDADGNPIAYDVYFSSSITSINSYDASVQIASNSTANYAWLPATLERGTTYYWRVVAFDSSGRITSGNVWSFTTWPNNPPSAPQLVGPFSGELLVTNNPTMRWIGSDVDNDNLTYNVYAGTNPSALSLVATTVNLVSNTASTVIDSFEDGNSVNPTWSSSVAALSVTTNTATGNGSYALQISGQATGYYVDYVNAYVATNNNVWASANYLRMMVYNAGALGDNFAVEIVDNDNGNWDGDDTGGGAGDDRWRYSVVMDWQNSWKEIFIPLTSSALSLNNSGIGDGILNLGTSGGAPGVVLLAFAVNSVTSAGSVKLAVDGIQLSSLAETKLAAPLTQGATYYWNVVATDRFGGTASSVTGSFTTWGNTAPNAPVLASPANGASGVTINPTITWTGSDPDGDVLTYNIYVSTNANALTLYASQKAITTSMFYSLDDKETYYWRVDAVDQFGAVARSTTQSFTTVAIPQYTPTIDTFEDVNLSLNPGWSVADNISITTSTTVASGQGTYSMRITGTANGLYAGYLSTYIADKADDWSQYTHLRQYVYNGGQVGDSMVIEIIDNDNNNGTVDEGASSAGDDRWKYTLTMDWTGGWREVSIPLASFVDSNPNTGNNVLDLAPGVSTPGALMLAYAINSVSNTGAINIYMDSVYLASAVAESTAPANISDVKLSKSNGNLVASWTAPADNQTVSYNLRYNVYRSSVANFSTSENVISDLVGNSTTVTMSAGSTLNYFMVKAIDEAGNRSASSNLGVSMILEMQASANRTMEYRFSLPSNVSYLTVSGLAGDVNTSNIKRISVLNYSTQIVDSYAYSSDLGGGWKSSNGDFAIVPSQSYAFTLEKSINLVTFNVVGGLSSSATTLSVQPSANRVMEYQFSMPYNSVYQTVSDIAAEMDTNIVSEIGVKDYATQTVQTYSYVSGTGWVASHTNFTIKPGVGYYITLKAGVGALNWKPRLQ